MGIFAQILKAEDIENFYLGQANPFLSARDLVELQKATGAVTSDLGTGFYNPKYGALAWAQLNLESNLWGILPKSTFPRRGWRVITGMDGDYSSMAIGETGALPDATYMPIEAYKAEPKQVVDKFEISDIAEALAEVTDEDIAVNAEILRKQKAIFFAKKVNQMISRKALGSAADGSDTEASAGLMFEALDRIVSSYEEAVAVGKPTAANIYGIDRSTAEWANAYVDMSVGDPQPLLVERIRNAYKESLKAGANPNVFVTGYDTYAKILGLYEVFMNFLPMQETGVQFDVGGVKTAEGVDAGMKVASVYGIPIIQAVDIPNDGDGTLNRMYLLDTTDVEGYGLPRLGVSVLRPVEYWEINNPIITNKFALVGVYRMAGELIGRRLAGQAKIRDIAE